ncbi:MAG TPA: HEAT repeat domain-containing protein [Planctomycetota bacterium]|nr:HEAT repeat domain-containing protein [Planctomycetota bacterium]
MQPAAPFLFSLLVALAPTGRTQEVQMTSGEVIAGELLTIENNRARIRGADGSLRVAAVRDVECVRAADGTIQRHAAALVDGPRSPEVAGLLARLRKGDALEVPELVQLTERCDAALCAELKQLTTHKSSAMRLLAARALAIAATPETVRAALEAALAESGSAMLGQVAGCLGNGAALAAIEAAGATKLVEQGMESKDRQARFGCAWLAAQLGSQAALPVLATFVGDVDHHLRESAAMCLAEHGNDAGAKVLLTIARRERSPEMAANRCADAATQALIERAARRERLRACELLGQLHHAAAVPMLRSFAAGKDAELAAVATKALAAIEAARDG